MARVECTVEDCMIAGDEKSRFKRDAEGTVVTCSLCGHAVEVRGRTERSVRYAMAKLREECPEGEENFYTEE